MKMQAEASYLGELVEWGQQKKFKGAGNWSQRKGLQKVGMEEDNKKMKNI